ncbi:MAG: hypothetical protein RR758_11820, partial [Burkholderiaceae bacterium]
MVTTKKTAAKTVTRAAKTSAKTAEAGIEKKARVTASSDITIVDTKKKAPPKLGAAPRGRPGRKPKSQTGDDMGGGLDSLPE